MWGRFFRGHPFVKDDKDVTEADFAKYHVVLFGDPGSNKWIARMNGKLPFKWTKESVTLGGKDLSGEREFSGDDLSESPQPGEICGAEYRPDHRRSRLQRRLRHAALGRLRHRQGEAGCRGSRLLTAGLFDENWQLPK